MNTKCRLAIFAVLMSVVLSTLGAAQLGANSEDMSVQEVEAFLREKIQGLSQSKTHSLALHLMRVCDEYRFPISSILSVINTESRFKIDAVSRVGAVGLMQVMPDTAGFVAHKLKIRAYHGSEDLYDPKTNVTIGVAYLSQLRERFGQSHRYLAAYNLGPQKYVRMKHRPRSVARYVKNISEGVAKIRQHALELTFSRAIVLR